MRVLNPVGFASEDKFCFLFEAVKDELSRPPIAPSLQGVVRLLVALEGLGRRRQRHPLPRVQEVWRYQVT